MSSTDNSPIDFYFDYSSPYSYIAAERVEDMLKDSGRTIRYCPILYGVITRQLNVPVLVNVPYKGAYSLRDFVRSAHYYGLEMNFPDPFPVATQAAARATLMLREQQHPQLAAFIRTVFRAYFVDRQDITQRETLGRVAQSLDMDAEAIMQADSDPQWKELLKATVQEASEKGLFGIPYFVVDGETFWGNDRLEQLQRWVTQGPF